MMEKTNYTLTFEFMNRPFILNMDGEKPNLVYLGEFKPPLKQGNELITIVDRLELEEFKDDIQRMLKLFEIDQASENEALSYVLTEMCIAHIQKYKRLVLSDLETYIDEILILVKDFSISNRDLISMKRGQELWRRLHEFGMLQFQKYLWVPSPLNPSQLVKLIQ